MIRLFACTLYLILTLNISASGEAKPLWRQLYQQADSLENNNQYDSAWVLAEKAFSLAKGELSPDDTALATILITMSDIQLLGKGNSEEAFKLAYQVLSLRQKTLGSVHFKVGEAYLQIGYLHYKQKEYDDAEKFFNKALQTTEGHVGRSHPEYVRSLYWIGSTYCEMELNKRADSVLRIAYETPISDTAANHGTIVGILRNLVTANRKMGQFEQAEDKQRDLIQVEAKEHGEVSDQVGGAIMTLGEILIDREMYDSSRSTYNEALKLARIVHGDNSVETSNNFFWLAIIHYRMGQLPTADSLMNEAVKIRLTHFNPRDFKVCELYQQRAIIQHKLENYATADSLFQLATQIDTTDSDENFIFLWQTVVEYLRICLEKDQLNKLREIGKQFDTLFSISNQDRVGLEPLVDYNLLIAKYFTKINNYRIAEAAYLEIRTLYGEEYGFCSKRYLEAEQWLASFYRDVGYENHDSDFLKSAIGLIRHSIYHIDREDVSQRELLANLQFSLAELYDTFGQIEQCNLLLDSVLSNLPQPANLKDSVGRTAIYSRVALVKAELGNSDASDSLMQLATSVFVKNGALIDSVKYQHILKSKIEASLAMENYDKAALYNDSLLRLVRATGQQSVDTLRTLSKIKDPRENDYNSLLYFHDFSKQYLNELKISALKAEGFSLLKISKKLRWPLNHYLSIYFGLKEKELKSIGLSASLVEEAHGAVTNFIMQRQKKLKKFGSDSTLAKINAALAHSLFYNHDQLDSIHIQAIDSILLLQATAEIDLLSKLDSSGRGDTITPTTDSPIWDILPKSSLTIEYFRWTYYDVKKYDETHYLGICRSNDKFIDMVDLGNAKYVDSLIELYRKQMAGRTYLPTVAETNEFKAISRKLYSTLIAPFEESLNRAQYLYLIPDGPLHMLSFAGLIDNEDHYLIEKIPLHYLGSNKSFEDSSAISVAAQNIIVFANPIFNLDSTESQQLAFEEGQNTDLRSVLRSLSSDCLLLSNPSLAPLPYTEREAKLIEQSIKKNSSESVTLKLGSFASEQEFKENAKGKKIIHLATHGFYLSSGCQTDSLMYSGMWRGQYFYENPYLLSGIFLTASDKQQSNADNGTFEDGILTALEVSSLDLRGTELVVLSACETGLGKIEASEGVYGLRRAFLEAGAQTVISALWSIDDKTTADIMSQLYVHSDELLPDRLRNIQVAKINELRKSGFADHPFTWGAFIAMGDWK